MFAAKRLASGASASSRVFASSPRDLLTSKSASQWLHFTKRSASPLLRSVESNGVKKAFFQTATPSFSSLRSSAVFSANSQWTKPFMFASSSFTFIRKYHASALLKDEEDRVPPVGSDDIVKPTDEFITPAVDPSPVIDPATVQQVVENVGIQLSLNPKTWFAVPMIQFEQMTGLPWWSVLVISAIALRIIQIPITGKILQSNARMKMIHPQIAVFNQTIQEMTKQGYSRKEIQDKYLEMRSFMLANGVHSPFKYLLLQFPLMIGFFTALFEIVKVVPSLHTGGALWFTDLAAADPYKILPVLSALGIYISMKFGVEKNEIPDPNAKRMNDIFIYVLSASLMIFTLNVSAALHIFWITTSVSSLLASRFFRLPSVRKFYDIPTVTSPPKQSPPFASTVNMPRAFANAPQITLKDESPTKPADANETTSSSQAKPNLRTFKFKTQSFKNEQQQQQKEKDNQE